MGMFNSIYVACPKCGKRAEFQTKSGSCTLSAWNLEEAPNREVEGILGDQHECQCGHVIRVDVDEPREVKIPVRVT